ncbi:MAG: transposase [Proteobacteria bacterium]|nr:transposase [Pseudomonadota bacterium]
MRDILGANRYLDYFCEYGNQSALQVQMCGCEGKSAMIVFETDARLKRNFKGHSFWSHGYYVSTVGLDEDNIRKYIKNQESNESIEDKHDSDLIDPF